MPTGGLSSHFAIPLTSRYVERTHTNTHHTLQHTLHKTTSFTNSINTLHQFLHIHTKYDTWLQQLPVHHLPANESIPMIQRRYHLLHKLLKRAIRNHKQLKKSRCTALYR